MGWFLLFIIAAIAIFAAVSWIMMAVAGWVAGYAGPLWATGIVVGGMVLVIMLLASRKSTKP